MEPVFVVFYEILPTEPATIFTTALTGKHQQVLCRKEEEVLSIVTPHNKINRIYALGIEGTLTEHAIIFAEGQIRLIQK